MNRYFSTVVEDSREAWDTMLSKKLRDAHENGYDEYASFWAQWSEVRHERVYPTA